MKLATILITGLGFIAVLGGFVVLTLAGKDTAVFVGFATSAAVFLIPQLLNLLKAHQTQSDMSTVQSDMAEVKERTNGPLTHMQEQVDLMATELHEHLKGGDNAGSS